MAPAGLDHHKLGMNKTLTSPLYVKFIRNEKEKIGGLFKFLAKFKTMKELRNLNIGILGGGQLGRMLSQAAIPLNIKLEHLDPDAQCPAANFSHKHTIGSFKETRDVREFGLNKDKIFKYIILRFKRVIFEILYLI